MSKVLPKVGDELFLRQFTGSYYIDIVKDPYTVIGVEENKVYVQSCKLTAPIHKPTGNQRLDRPDLEGQRVFFYDTVAEKIEPDPHGDIVKLVWHKDREMWGTPGKRSDYPKYAIFGKYMHQPYLD